MADWEIEGYDNYERYKNMRGFDAYDSYPHRDRESREKYFRELEQRQAEMQKQLEYMSRLAKLESEKFEALVKSFNTVNEQVRVLALALTIAAGDSDVSAEMYKKQAADSIAMLKKLET